MSCLKLRSVPVARALVLPWLPASIACLVCSPATAATLKVEAGQSIQAAVSRAAPGDRIEVHPGLYSETVYIDKDRIELHGVVEEGRWPVLDGEGKRNDGVLISGHGVTVEHLWVKRFKGNGIMTQGANNYRIVHNRVEGPCFYAIFPQYGKNGLVAYNVVSGSDDAAIYVGMSDGVDVIHNETYGSVMGIESENSHDIFIAFNSVHDNVLGIAITMLPGLPVKSSDNIVVRDNFIANNNAKNWAPPGAITAALIPGVGVLVLGTDRTVIENNFIEGHQSVGVVVAETSFFVSTPDDKIDPFPDGAVIRGNVMLNNGAEPQGGIKDLLELAGRTRGVDVISTGKGRDHCIAGKASLTTLGVSRFAECGPPPARPVATLRPPRPIEAKAYTAEQKGRFTYLAVCTGCHAYDSKLVGPPMVTVKALYGKDAQKLADWIARPTHKREDYAEMPPQDYLPPEVRMAVARYVLEGLSR